VFAVVARFVCVVSLAVLATTFSPIVASAESGRVANSQSVAASNASLLSIRLAAAQVALEGVCTSFGVATAESFPADASGELAAAVANRPTPERVSMALATLSDPDADESARGLAAIATNRFFFGVCGADGDAKASACILYETLRVAQPIQAELLAGQVQFALHALAVPDSLADALSVLTTPAETLAEDDFSSAIGVVDTELGRVCADKTAADAQTNNAPQTLPKTGFDDASIELLQFALAILAAGAAMLAMQQRRLARPARPLHPWQ